MKKVLTVQGNNHAHWVGDGFPVRTLFFYQPMGAVMSPFLMLDYAGPAQFTSTTQRRGVGAHPHRGFETVSIVYSGEVAHRDSTGQSGTIGPGDVQWMTAGAGILHDEFHSEQFAKRGGELEMVQLWVNLPAAYKMTPPGYQAIEKAQMPEVQLPNAAGIVRVIAGDFQGQKGAARTFTPMQVWDVYLKKDTTVILPAAINWNAALVVRRGAVISDSAVATDARMLVFDQHGQDVEMTALEDTAALWLSGAPLNEPIVGHGPFVMNTQQEIVTAIEDFHAGKFGYL
jgi:redox-sensitive bicupin YhaK (pirin superfamily)